MDHALSLQSLWTGFIETPGRGLVAIIADAGAASSDFQSRFLAGFSQAAAMLQLNIAGLLRARRARRAPTSARAL